MLEKKYNALIKREKFDKDESQIELIRKLDLYKNEIESKKHHSSAIHGFLYNFLPGKHYDIHGMYIWGEVGRGKSMLMDLFYENLKLKKKHRVHFHEFMLEFHSSLQEWRGKHKGTKKAKDPIPKLAKQIAKKHAVLCFDELQVTNIADAMILGRLFSLLIEYGVFIIITSNRVPDDLYKDGLQRENFLPFIDLIKDKMEVYHLNNFKDYRMDKLGDLKQTFFHPNNAKSKKAIENIIFDLTGHENLEERAIEVNDSRTIRVLNSYGTLAVFTFKELCEANYGAIDYLKLCHNFSTIIIKNIPQLSPDNHNEALRFITLIDCMYDNNTKLICSAATSPEKLYKSGKNKFEFERTVSRLIEMQSHEYLNAELSETA